MEFKQIKELMAAMGRFGIGKVVLKEGENELQLEREDLRGPAVYGNAPNSETEARYPYVAPLPPAEMPIAHPPSADAGKQEKDTSKYVTSPMVGTFYSSPSPDAPPFVKIGDHVSEGTVVCIIEAMKVLNEVKAGVSGTVTELLLESGHPVEFGSKIFRVV